MIVKMHVHIIIFVTNDNNNNNLYFELKNKLVHNAQ